MFAKTKENLKKIYHQLVEIDDTPQKISGGVGLGVFLGVLPGTGPIAAITLAVVFKLNRAAALSGSLLVNTWINFVIFPLAVKLGSIALRLDWRVVYAAVAGLFRDFHWGKFLTLVFTESFFAVFLGYVILGLFAGVLAYFLTLAALAGKRKSG
jgi:uncharacterized protein (DUF2062 family)